MRIAYWNYIESILTTEEGEEYQGMNKFWSFIKNNRKDNTGISNLKKHGKLTSDPLEKAYILNNQFKSVFTIKPQCQKTHSPNISPSIYA